MKYQWARDDPAFLVLFCLVLAGGSTCSFRVCSFMTQLIQSSPPPFSRSEQHLLRPRPAPVFRRLAETRRVAGVCRLYRLRARGGLPILVRGQPLPAHQLHIALLRRPEFHRLPHATDSPDRRGTRVPDGLDARHWRCEWSETRESEQQETRPDGRRGGIRVRV